MYFGALSSGGNTPRLIFPLSTSLVLHLAFILILSLAIQPAYENENDYSGVLSVGMFGSIPDSDQGLENMTRHLNAKELTQGENSGPERNDERPLQSDTDNASHAPVKTEIRQEEAAAMEMSPVDRQVVAAESAPAENIIENKVPDNKEIEVVADAPVLTDEEPHGPQAAERVPGPAQVKPVSPGPDQVKSASVAQVPAAISRPEPVTEAPGPKTIVPSPQEQTQGPAVQPSGIASAPSPVKSVPVPDMPSRQSKENKAVYEHKEEDLRLSPKEDKKEKTAPVASDSGVAEPQFNADIKILITGSESLPSGLKTAVSYKEFSESRRNEPLTRRESNNIKIIVPIILRYAGNALIAAVETTTEGIYDFTAECTECNGKPFNGKVTLRLYEKSNRQMIKSLGAMSLADKYRIIKILMPEGILWDDNSYFDGHIEDSESITKFKTSSGLTWREYKE